VSYFEVVQLLLDESSVWQALLVLGVVSLIYFGAFRNRLHSLFDPLVYVLVMSSVATSMLLLMTWAGAISTLKCAFVLATLLLFYGGFLLSDRSASFQPASPTLWTQRHGSAFALSVIFWINCVLLGVSYTFFGIPLFLESRLEQFAGSGGFGAIGRFLTGIEFCGLVLAFIAMGNGSRRSFWAKAIVVQFAVSALLSGSKGGILFAVFAWYLARVYASGGWCRTEKLPRKVAVFVGLVLLFPIVVIVIQSAEGGLLGAAGALAMRIAGEADAYAYFLGADAIDRIARFDLIAPLRPVLAAFRLVPAESSINPGSEIISEVLGVDSPSAGPNSRLAVYLLFYYSYGGILLAPLLGVMLGVMRNLVARHTRHSPMVFAIAAAAYLHMTKVEVDPQLTIAGLFGLALVLPLLGIAANGRLLRPSPHAASGLTAVR
jgi:hypothetical protein